MYIYLSYSKWLIVNDTLLAKQPFKNTLKNRSLQPHNNIGGVQNQFELTIT